ncbi:MAG: ABC transporter substrate-binding protein [Clostridiales bacterium]|nr:ABC transporter substrate-binding protein [Clostridiales bacterium]
MKKLLAIVLSLALCLSCSAALADEKVPYIGIIQQMEHVALDQAREGFIQALKDKGYEDGVNIKLNYQNGQGDKSNLATIADQFVGDNADLVLAIATDAAKTMAGKTETIPVLGTAITDYVIALLAESNEKPGYNISGTSDMNPVESQIALIHELFPDAKTVGVLYTSSEDNSVLQAQMAKAAIEKLNLAYTEVTVTNTNDVQQATQQIVTQCDAIYIPTDNVFASAMPIVYGVVADSKTPVITGEAGMAMAGGLATLGLQYYDLGYQTGLMAVEVLNGADVSTMPIQFANSGYAYTFNKTMADEIGFEIPEKYLEYAQEMEAAK